MHKCAQKIVTGKQHDIIFFTTNLTMTLFRLKVRSSTADRNNEAQSRPRMCECAQRILRVTRQLRMHYQIADVVGGTPQVCKYGNSARAASR